MCGLHPKSNRGKLDLGGSTAYYPFQTAGGRQRIKTVDLDDAYRIAMQGRSPECRKFRDFLVEILRRIERGETIDPKPPHAAAGDPDASPLVHQAALLLKIALKSAEHDRQLAVLRADADRVEARRFEADRAMRTLPSAAIPVPAMSKIDLTERLVRLWCNVNGCDFQLAHRRLHEEIRRRLHYDAAARLKKHPAGTTKLDVIRVEPPRGVALGDFQEMVYAIANELFPRELRIVDAEA